MRKLAYFFEEYRWLKAFFSPFTSPKIKCYIGKTKIGVPYFLPRKWVRFNKEDCIRKATEDSKRPMHIKYGFDPKSIAHHYVDWTKPVPLTIGFNYCSLGWKTKYNDIRHEWNPVFSFVFFGYQIALTIWHEHDSHFWESWLYYEYRTDKTKSKRERIEQCRKEAPQTWTVHKHNQEPVTTDYYTKILKVQFKIKEGYVHDIHVEDIN
jgi:hypothetical protein